MSRPGSFVHEWIELVERSGLLVSEPVLHRFFPSGPETVEARRQRQLLGAWERFQVEPEDSQRQTAWLDAVFELLEWPEGALLRGSRLPADASVHLPELDQWLRPYGVLQDEEGRSLLGLWRVPSSQGFDRVERVEGSWRATPHMKVERWLRRSRNLFGLLMNGSSFRLVHAPPELPASWIEFPASLFFEEKSVLDGFFTLLSRARFLGPAGSRLERLAEESQKTQAELTDSLGEQVRNAVETLILALDRADRGLGGRVLSVPRLDADEIYKAAVYAVMRLVFILFAEERNLLPHGNVFFDEGYGLGRLLHLLEEEKRTRPETFEEGYDAWPRLLALFRVIFHGSGHPDLTLPAYGGDLFSPQGFPAVAALENPFLRLANRDIYEILRALTFGEARVGRDRIAQRYSYRNLDVEHIGYLYEGLLDHRVARAGREPLVKLATGTETAIPLPELEKRSGPELIDFLEDQKVFGGDRDRIAARLSEPTESVSPAVLRGVATAEVMERCRPLLGVIQPDGVVEPGRLYLTTSASRRSTGTHYTPIQYTRAMVKETLDPLVYVGEHGKLEEPLRLRSPREILDLKVCDPAMGSGAFLVQVIRYLSEKLTDAWQVERERRGEKMPLYLPYAEPAADREDRIPLPEEREEAELWARRFVAERCVYGVDKNPLAVEMAKLSIWLVTLAKDKPFSFVDHALKPGDSLLGLSSLDQLRTWSLDGKSETRLFEREIEKKLDEAVKLRRQISDSAVVTTADVARKEKQLAEANQATRGLWALADLLIATVLRSKKQAEQAVARAALLSEATHRLDDPEGLEGLARKELKGQAPLHWALAFPEVFERENGGFDAFVGNPPYMGGQKITGAFGETYREYLVELLAAGARGSADLVSYFFLQAYGLLRDGGNLGLLAISTIAEGDTRQIGLEQLLHRGATIYSAHPIEPWPNQAAVFTSRVHVHRGKWEGRQHLRGFDVSTISAFLTGDREWTQKRLKANDGIAFQGSIVLGMGFMLAEEEALAMIERDPRNAAVLFPYLTGEDLNSHPEQKPSRWVINFWDWPEERARTYPEPYDIVQRKVKPGRMKVNRKSRRERWWQFAELASGLYHAIGRGHSFASHPRDWAPELGIVSQVIAIARVSSTSAFISVPNSWVFSERVILFVLNELRHLAVLQSNLHIAWAWRYSSRLKLDLNYSPTDCFETFPFPIDITEIPEALGGALEKQRATIMSMDSIGLTKLYRRLHNPAEDETEISRLRALHEEVDQAVALAYGWSDLDLQHDFHEVPYLPENDRIRFTVSEEARRKILDRLSQLNRERYEEEVAQGLHDKKKPTKGARAGKSSKSAASATAEPFAPPPQQTLFPIPQMGLWEAPKQPSPAEGKDSEAAPDGLSRSAADLLGWLQKGKDWRSRSEAVEALGLSTSEWNQAIQELLAAGLAERTGEKRGTRYRAK